MSATEQMRAMLDGLMGTARDGSDSKRQHLNFTDQRVCRAFLLDCCPHDIFASTKLELGECSKVHDPALRADYILANQSQDYMYELSALERLQSFVNDADKKTEYLKRKLAETQEELTAEETSKLNRVHDLTEKLGKKLAQVDKAEADGDLEAKQKFHDEAERIKKERIQAEAEYRQVSRPASSHQQQNLRVCDVCSAYLGINDNDSRLADHFGGKLHLGFITVREKLEDLKKRCADRGGGQQLQGRGGNGADRDYADYGRERHYGRDRDRGRDRERDRDRDRAREDKYRDRERDRSRSGSRYYRSEVRYGSRGPREPPLPPASSRDRVDYSSRDRDYATSRDHPSSRDDRHMSRDRPRYRDDRMDRERVDRDRLDRGDRHSGGSSAAALPPSSGRSRPAGPFDRANSDGPRYHESEISYQRKLREWEKREDEKARKFAIREAEERDRRLLEEQESRKLKEFLEDYKDDRDDIRFYRGSALARRLADRRKEIEQDEQCRQKERIELELLSRSCGVTNNDNNSSPIQLIDRVDGHVNNISALGGSEATATATTTATTFATTNSLNGDNNDKSQEQNIAIANRNETNSSNSGGSANNHSQNASSTSQQQNSRAHPSNHQNNNNKTSSEEKRKQVEELIGKIPTDKEQLFARKLDWSLLDENLMEKRIRPWVTKKVAEYMGEKEVELIDFICALLNDHKDGNSMLKEVAIVLDDEAEKFVVHMWRLLIFELEAKRIGLRK